MSSNKLPGVNVLLQGEAGTGKTYSIGTLVDHCAKQGIEAFYLACEPGFESLFGYWKDKGKDIPDNLHWHHAAPPKTSFGTLIKNATAINTMSFESLTKMTDPDRNKHNYFLQILEVLNNFKDDRTGKEFGPVDSWDTDRVLIIDPLTGLNRAVMSLVIGGKPIKAMHEWGIAQDQLEKLLYMLTNDCRCHFVLAAHVEREIDQVVGGMKITVSTLGKALAPKIPPMFSDVIYTYRDNKSFFWSTANSQVALKTRNLPIEDKLPQDFSAIFSKWQSRQSI